MTIDKMMQIGKRWQKNGMDRIYVNKELVELVEVDGIMVCKFFNRYNWQSLKIYYDVNKEELVVTTGNDEAKKAVASAIEMILE